MAHESLEFLLKQARMKAEANNGQIERPGPDGFCVFWPAKNLFAIYSIGVEQDGEAWAHISVSRRSPNIIVPPSEMMLPSPMDLDWVKEQILGDVEAYTVLPIKSKKINIHKGVMHFFHCYSLSARGERKGGILPDFTRGGKSL